MSPKRQRDQKESEEHDYPCRDHDNLFTSRATIDCALHKHCVPCAYKVATFDVALDAEFCKSRPNQRPELCPRSKQFAGLVGTFGYQYGMNVLLIGDGDFTFSLAVARMLNGEGGNLVATSYESKETLLRIYPDVNERINELRSLGVTVCFGVDGTRIKETLPESESRKLFDRIVWNFPCTAVEAGQDGQNDEMEHNKDLVRQFVGCARRLLDLSKGEIHITHKTKPPFNQWKIEEVALELSQSDDPRVRFEMRIVFDRSLFPPYVPRKALHFKSFPCHDACTYIFSVGKEIAPNNIDKTDDTTAESSLVRSPDSSQLVRVTRQVIWSIRSTLLKSNLSNKKNSKRRRRS